VYRHRTLFDELRGRVWRVFEKNRLCDTESNGTTEELRERGHGGGLRGVSRNSTCIARSELCMPIPVPFPAKIWKPMISAEEELLLRV
jgi:hypothetical protein